MPKTPTIYVAEGPAGAGKSTLLQGIIEIRPETYCPPRPVYPRNRGPKAGAHSQSVYDYTAVLYAVINQEDVWCDRFLASRIVYRWIENNNVDPMETWYSDLKNSWTQLKITAIREANFRLEMNVRPQPVCKMHFLLPDLNTLCDNRLRSGKDYPFSPALELSYFTHVYSVLSAYPIQGIEVTKEPVYAADL